MSQLDAGQAKGQQEGTPSHTNPTNDDFIIEALSIRTLEPAATETVAEQSTKNRQEGTPPQPNPTTKEEIIDALSVVESGRSTTGIEKRQSILRHHIYYLFNKFWQMTCAFRCNYCRVRTIRFAF